MLNAVWLSAIASTTRGPGSAPKAIDERVVACRHVFATARDLKIRPLRAQVSCHPADVELVS